MQGSRRSGRFRNQRGSRRPADAKRSADEASGWIDTVHLLFLTIGATPMGERNPYASASMGPAQVAGSYAQTPTTPKRVLVYSYCTSVAAAFTVVVIWLFVVFNDSSVPQSQRRTSPPDLVEWIFLIVTTLPSVFTCLLFSLCYCSVFKLPEKRKLWPAIVFGGTSGMMFNAMTAIWLIENFFDW